MGFQHMPPIVRRMAGRKGGRVRIAKGLSKLSKEERTRIASLGGKAKNGNTHREASLSVEDRRSEDSSKVDGIFGILNNTTENEMESTTPGLKVENVNGIEYTVYEPKEYVSVDSGEKVSIWAPAGSYSAGYLENFIADAEKKIEQLTSEISRASSYKSAIEAATPETEESPEETRIASSDDESADDTTTTTTTEPADSTEVSVNTDTTTTVENTESETE